MSTREKAKAWIESMGGSLRDDDMVFAWCHEDTQPSAKLYDNHRVRCFACNKTFFSDTKPQNKRTMAITREEYDVYRHATGQTGSWPSLVLAAQWIREQKELEKNG